MAAGPLTLTVTDVGHVKYSHALLLAIITLHGSVCLAHRDRTVSVEADGTIVGLPPEFGPSVLHVSFASPDSGAPPVSTVQLHLGTTSTTLPVCVTGLLLTRGMNDVRVLASWYHDEAIVPYYLNVVFFDPGYVESRWPNPGYSLLFNLRTGKLLSMEVLVIRDNGRGIQHVPVNLDARCSAEELREFHAAH